MQISIVAMKVLQILPELNAGGVERGTLEIAAALVAAGHESLVVSHGGRLVEALEAGGSRHLGLPVHRKHLASLLQVRPLRRLLEKEQPDILHIRSRVPGWIAWLAWRGMRPEKRPHLVSTVHGFYSTNAYSAVMTRGERVIAVSSSIRDYILRHYPKTPEECIRVIPRGIDLSCYGADFQPDAAWRDRWASEQPQVAGKLTLLLPGRITRLKGHEDFFRLIARLKSQGYPALGLVAGSPQHLPINHRMGGICEDGHAVVDRQMLRAASSDGAAAGDVQWLESCGKCTSVADHQGGARQ